jgi:predicted branched-subunit amino acid permease
MSRPDPGNPSSISVPDPDAVRQAFITGARAAGPVVVAYIPFALALGAALAATSVNEFTAWSSSWLIFAGAAQLVAVDLLHDGAGLLVAIVTALVVNARHTLYSASLAPRMADWPTGRRWVGAYFLADPVYALALGRFHQSDGGGHARARFGYYLGAGVTCWVGWQVLTGTGVLMGGVFPESMPLGLAAPLTFLLLLIPQLQSRAEYLAALVGGAVALSASGLPSGLGLLVGAGTGVIAGALAGGRDE